MRIVPGIAIVCALLAVACSDAGPGRQWTEQELATDADLMDVFFLDANRGWVVGGGYGTDGGILGATEDGGRSWQFRSGIVRPAPRSNLFHLHAVWFIDEARGIIAADAGRILRTLDGGEHWHQVHREPGFTPILDLQFVDEKHGWAVARDLVLRTGDGGETWTREDPGKSEPSFSARAIRFLDLRRGWAVGDHGGIHLTEDGGMTWTRVSNLHVADEPDLIALDFADPGHGWAVGEDGTILHTPDGGWSWIRQTSGTTVRLTDVHFADASTGWAVGYDRSDSSSTILHTRDGGMSWIPERRVEGQALNALCLVEGAHVWAVGERIRPSAPKLLRYGPS